MKRAQKAGMSIATNDKEFIKLLEFSTDTDEELNEILSHNMHKFKVVYLSIILDNAYIDSDGDYWCAAFPVEYL